jgi:phosphoglycerate kinase
LSFRTLDDLPADLRGRRVLVRCDLNVPMQDGRVADATRLEASVPTLRELRSRGADVLILSHFGRPKGRPDPSFSLRPVVPALAAALDEPVLLHDWVAHDRPPPPGVVVLENMRFDAGEERNDPQLARRLAALGDLYVNDAFSAAHRAHASTAGIAHLLPAYAGRAMEAELRALEAGLGNPRRPVVAVVGGAKVSTKIEALTNLVERVDHLVIGGAMANTFLAARGVAIGRSLHEPDHLETARTIAARADEAGSTLHLPFDVVVAREFRAHAPHRVANVHEVAADEMILDLGPHAVEALGDVLKTCRTLVWNGPLGAFELPPFDTATVALARMAAALTSEGSLTSVAGGGDTIAALNQAGVADRFTFVSTAGGAFLEWMEGRALPGVEALKQKVAP